MDSPLSISRYRPAATEDASAPSTPTQGDTLAGTSRLVRASSAPAELLGLKPMRPPVESDGNVPDLPDVLWADIASRVDTKTLHRMRAVSKSLKRGAEANAKQLTVTTRDGLKALKHPDAYAALEKLTLDGDFCDDDLKGLPASLKELDLSGCRAQITSEGIAHLSRLPLVRLNVSHNRIDADGARSLAAMRTLTDLDISHNDIRTEGAQALAGSATLTSLKVGNNRIGDGGRRHWPTTPG